MNETDKQIKVSFIVPMFNVAEYIEQCLESIIGAFDSDEMEIIVIDDGSTDNSAEIVSIYTERYKEIVLLQQTNRGQSVARNVGIRAAKGEYICFCDSDDYVDTEDLRKLYEICEYNKLDYIKTGWKTLTPDGKVHYNVPPENMKIKDIVVTSEEYFVSAIRKWYNVVPFAALYRRKWMDENNIVFPEGIQFEDNTFQLQICLSDLNARVMQTDIPYYNVRIRENSTTTGLVGPKKIYDQLDNIDLMNRFIEDNVSEKLFPLAKRAVSSLTFTMTSYYYRLEPEDREKVRNRIERGILMDAIRYPQSQFQRMKLIGFTWFPQLLDVYEVVKNNRGGGNNRI